MECKLTYPDSIDSIRPHLCPPIPTYLPKNITFDIILKLEYQNSYELLEISYPTSTKFEISIKYQVKNKRTHNFETARRFIEKKPKMLNTSSLKSVKVF